MLLKGYAAAEVAHDRLFGAAAAEACSRLNQFDPQGLAGLVWSFGKVGHYEPRLMEGVAAVAEASIGAFKPQELANLAWGYAAAGHSAPGLFRAIAVQAAARARSLKPQEMVSLVWSFRGVGAEEVEPALMEALGVEVWRQWEGFREDEFGELEKFFFELGYDLNDYYPEV